MPPWVPRFWPGYQKYFKINVYSKKGRGIIFLGGKLIPPITRRNNMDNSKKIARLKERIKNTNNHIAEIKEKSVKMEQKLKEKLQYLDGKIKEYSKK